ncbi:unnamed protein product [Amoebophrya sp. A25]|nr:unnamed protein product [Amoebophrya sp. A25]|eukprot:GSA25T00026433001.1
MPAVNRLSAAVLGQGEYQHPSEPSVNAVYSEWTGYLAKATTRTEVARSLNTYPRRELVRPSYAGAVQVSQSKMDIAENCIAIDYKPPTTPEAKFSITDHLGNRGNFEEAGNRLRKRYRLPMEPLPQRRADYTEDLHPLELCPDTQQVKDASTGEREPTSPSARARTFLRLPGASDEEEDDTLFLDVK